MSNNQVSKPIEIKISTVVAVSVLLRQTDLGTLDAEMKKMTNGTADYFDHEFAVIDLAECDFSHGAIDWQALTDLFRSYSLNPVAVRNSPAEMENDIVAHGLSIDVFVKPRQSIEETMSPPAVVDHAPPMQRMETMPAIAMIVDTPVRAGQRVYARGTDLIVTAVVNSGAELIADGSIHIYAPLRGRALAGATGDAQARIFALSMEAELVSVAGTYRTFEDGLPDNVSMKPAQVRLDGDRIDVLPILTRA